MLDNDIIAAAQDTIHAEAEALSTLAESLNDRIVQAVRMIAQIKGRLILTGIGKSGHIACKIAATLASTGTPAHFVHPSEAAHGDLGMITPQDAIIALSKSGNSSEFIPLLDYAKRCDIQVLAITQKVDSPLARYAQIVLLIPALGETPFIDTPAPTLSTTMMLALGDALAVSLLKLRGFTNSDFAKLHPGGLLGAQLSTVDALMHKASHMPLIDQDATVHDAILEISNKRFGCTGVIDNGRLVGIITDGDLRRHLKTGLLDRTAKEIATHNPKTIPKTMLAIEAINVMEASKITALFVTENDLPIGIVHLHDLLDIKVR